MYVFFIKIYQFKNSICLSLFCSGLSMSKKTITFCFIHIFQNIPIFCIWVLNVFHEAVCSVDDWGHLFCHLVFIAFACFVMSHRLMREKKVPFASRGCDVMFVNLRKTRRLSLFKCSVLGEIKKKKNMKESCNSFPIPTAAFVLTDLWDDLQHGAVLRDPQQPGLLKVQSAGHEGRTSLLFPSHPFYFFFFS